MGGAVRAGPNGRPAPGAGVASDYRATTTRRDARVCSPVTRTT